MDKFIKKLNKGKVLYITILFILLTIISLVGSLIVGDRELNDWWLIPLEGFIFTVALIIVILVVVLIYYIICCGKFWEFENLKEARDHQSKKRKLRKEIKILKIKEKHKKQINKLEDKKGKLSEEKN